MVVVTLFVLISGVKVQAANLSVSVGELGDAIASIPNETDALQRLMLEKIQRELEDSNLVLSEGELLFSDTSYDITADSGCTRTEVRFLTTDITLASDTRLDLSLSSLNDPVRIGIDLNARIAVNGRAKQIVGFRLGSCQDLGNDNFSFSATGNAQLSVFVELRLNPALDTSGQTLVLRPEVVLDGELTRQNITVDVDDSLLRGLLEEVIEDQIDDALDGRAVVAAIDELEQQLGESLDSETDDGVITIDLPEPTDPQIDALYRLLSPDGDFSLSLGYVRTQRIPLLAALIVGDSTTTNGILSKAVQCEAAGLLQIPLPHHPVHKLSASGCMAAQIPTDVRGPFGNVFDDAAQQTAADTQWYEDAACQRTLDFHSISTIDYCNAVLDTSRLGNAASLEEQLESWTLSPGTRFDIGAVSVAGRQQPFTQRVAFKRIATEQGECALEMRIHSPHPASSGTPSPFPSLRPLIAYHGGSWQRRSSGALGIEAFATTLVDQGFVVFAPFYRLIGTEEGNSECNNATLEQVLEDAHDAMDWVQANAERYGAAGNPALFGQSAGGHLAGILSVERSDEVASAALFYAPTDFADFARQLIDGEIDTQTGQRILESVLGESLETLDINAPFIQRNSVPARIINDNVDMPPLFLLHGQMDTVLPFDQSVRLCQALAGELSANLQADSSSAVVQSTELRTIRLCGDNGSQLHLIAEGEHALDLCIADELCLAGSPESAAVTAESIDQMLGWLKTAGLQNDAATLVVLEDEAMSTSSSGGSAGWTLIILLLAGKLVRLPGLALKSFKTLQLQKTLLTRKDLMAS